MDIKPLDQLIDLDGKVAIVTGGSSGIGEAICYRLAEAGAKIVIASRSDDEGQRVLSTLKKQNREAIFVKTDVSSEDDVKKLVDMTINTFSSINILVNNAGIYPINTFVEMTTEDFDKVIGVNLKGVFLSTKYVSQKMIEQGSGGKIINITSIDTLHPSMIGLAHYDASKHGVLGFSKNIALELAKHNIYVNCVAPGGISTTGIKNNDDKSDVKSGKDFLSLKPLGRMGGPDEVAKAVLFLSTDMSSYVVGSQIIVDGGTLLA